MYEQKVVVKKLIQLNPTGPVFQKCVETARECSKTVQNTADRVKCSYGKFSSPLTQIPVGKTEISGTQPARPLIWTYPKFYKGFRGKARSRETLNHLTKLHAFWETFQIGYESLKNVYSFCFCFLFTYVLLPTLQKTIIVLLPTQNCSANCG